MPDAHGGAIKSELLHVQLAAEEVLETQRARARWASSFPTAGHPVAAWPRTGRSEPPTIISGNRITVVRKVARARSSVARSLHDARTGTAKRRAGVRRTRRAPPVASIGVNIEREGTSSPSRGRPPPLPAIRIAVPARSFPPRKAAQALRRADQRAPQGALRLLPSRCPRSCPGQMNMQRHEHACTGSMNKMPMLKPPESSSPFRRRLTTRAATRAERARSSRARSSCAD